MATLPTLSPNADNAGNQWLNTSGGSTNVFATCDDSIAFPNDGDFARAVAATNGSRADFELTDMPSDFVSMDTLSIQVRYRVTGWSNDTINLEALVVDSAGSAKAAGPGGGVLTIATGITSSSFINSSVIAFDTVTPSNKTTWDGCRLQLYQGYTVSMGSDGARIDVSAVELTGTYTAAAAGKAMPQQRRDARLGALIQL